MELLNGLQNYIIAIDQPRLEFISLNAIGTFSSFLTPVAPMFFKNGYS